MMLDTDGTAYFIFTGKQGSTHATKLYRRAKQEMEDAKALGEQPRWEVFNWTSFDNPYISKEALGEIAGDMSSRAFDLEIMAIDDEDDSRALWSRALLDKTRVHDYPIPTRIIVGVDPPGSITNDCGIVVACCGYVGDVLHGYVLEDLSLMGTPSQWAEQTIAAYHKHSADRIVAERNFGGDMVENTIRTVEQKVPVKLVQASRGKVARADPIVSLFEKEKAHMVGEFPALESELCRWHPTLFKGQPSPNRLDAMVWALSDLMLDYCLTEVGSISFPMMI
jgi:phage terminase large subunit-like protein